MQIAQGCCAASVFKRLQEHFGANSDLTLHSEGSWTKDLLRFCMQAAELGLLDKDCLCFKKLDVGKHGWVGELRYGEVEAGRGPQVEHTLSSVNMNKTVCSH